MTIRTSYTDTGIYQAGEGVFRIYRRTERFDNTSKGIIALHGHGASAIQFLPFPTGNFASIGTHAAALAQAGYVVLSVDAGGETQWSNSQAMTAITNGYNYLTSTGGAAAGKVGILAWSMGGLTALNWMKRNLSLSACAVLYAPATNLDTYHNNSNYTREIDIAYTSTTTNPTGSGQITFNATTVAVNSTTGFAASGTFGIGTGNTEDTVTYSSKTSNSFIGCTVFTGFDYTPTTQISHLGDYNSNSVSYKVFPDASTFHGAGIPIRINQGLSDATVSPSATEAYVNAVNDPIVTLKEYAGLTHVSVMGGMSSDEIVRYFKSNF